MNCETCGQHIKAPYIEPDLRWLQQQSKRWVSFTPVSYWWELLEPTKNQKSGRKNTAGFRPTSAIQEGQ